MPASDANQQLLPWQYITHTPKKKLVIMGHDCSCDCFWPRKLKATSPPWLHCTQTDVFQLVTGRQFFWAWSSPCTLHTSCFDLQMFVLTALFGNMLYNVLLLKCSNDLPSVFNCSQVFVILRCKDQSPITLLRRMRHFFFSSLSGRLASSGTLLTQPSCLNCNLDKSCWTVALYVSQLSMFSVTNVILEVESILGTNSKSNHMRAE